MLIDWPTVLFQAINFLILVLVLRKILFLPVLRAMREREDRLALEMRQAEQARAQAEDLERALAEREKAIAEERAQVLAQARRESESWREQALAQARREVASLRAEWLDQLDRERDAFSRALRTRMAEAVTSVCRKALDDLADGGFGQRLAAVLLERIELKAVRSARRITVATGFEPDEAMREELRRGLARIAPNLEEGLEFSYEPSLGFGVRLQADDRAIEWSANAYFEGLEREVLATLDERMATRPKEDA